MHNLVKCLSEDPFLKLYLKLVMIYDIEKQYQSFAWLIKIFKIFTLVNHILVMTLVCKRDVETCHLWLPWI